MLRLVTLISDAKNYFDMLIGFDANILLFIILMFSIFGFSQLARGNARYRDSKKKTEGHKSILSLDDELSLDELLELNLDDELSLDDELNLDDLLIMEEDELNLDLEDELSLDDFIGLEDELELDEELDLEFIGKLIDFDARKSDSEIILLSNQEKENLVKRLDVVANEISDIKSILMESSEKKAIDLSK